MKLSTSHIRRWNQHGLVRGVAQAPRGGVMGTAGGRRSPAPPSAPGKEGTL